MNERFAYPGEWLKTQRRKLAVALAGTTLAFTGCTVSADNSPTPVSPMSSPGHDTVGDCDPYTVFAQNRWSPRGAAVRAEPDIKSAKVGSLGGNEVVTVTGWEREEPVYPTNPRPWQGDVWYRLDNPAPYFYKDGGDNVVWVNSAAVRSVPTQFDPTSRESDSSTPASMPSGCELK